MFRSSFLALLGLQQLCAIATPLNGIKGRTDAKFTLKDIKAFAPESELKTSDKALNLKQVGTNSRSSQALLRELASRTTALNPVSSGGGYAIDVDLSGETFEVIFDTGSSDLWVFHAGVQCVGPREHSKPSSYCDFGPTFNGTYEKGEVTNQNFNITYADQEFLIGTLGYEDVTVAGVTVKHQEMALVDEGYWFGDGITSGIMGFAYSSLTSAFTGTDPANDDPDVNNAHYVNWINKAIKQKKFPPMFSCAIERGPNGGSGQLALGGLPDISFDHKFVSTPLKIIEMTPHPIEQKQYSYYTIIPNSIVLEGEYKNTSLPVIVDTGTTLVYLPERLATEINEAFDPPSVFVKESGVFENYCDATPPKFAITIGGEDFLISPHELLLNGSVGRDPSTGGCITGIQVGPTGAAILGDVFLKNVVAVFDIGASQMKFAHHEHY